MKLKVQAQHLQPGDIVGSGETIIDVILTSISFPSNKICVYMKSKMGVARTAYWGKYTMINVERKTIEEKYEGGLTDEDLDVDGFGP